MSLENQLFLRFINLLIAPLSAGIESGEIALAAGRTLCRRMKDVLQDVDQGCDVETSPGEVVSNDVAATSPYAADEESGATSISGIDRWLSIANTLAPRQLAAAREIEIIRILEVSKEGVLGQHLRARLDALGLTRGQSLPAFRTQLSRLKRERVIHTEIQGVYLAAKEAPARLELARTLYAALWVPEDARATVS